MLGSEKKIKVLYIVNARIPNERANGVQIANTCAGLDAQGIDVTLVSRKSKEKSESIASYYKLSQTFKHVELFTLDIPNLPFRYFFRNFFFVVFAQVYIFVGVLQTFFTRRTLVVYVRGETVLSLIPLSYIVPVFFETHQIRNYERLYRIALQRAKGVVVITERLKTKFVEEYCIPSKKILVARDSVDLKKFQNIQPNSEIWFQHSIPYGKKIILYSGTLAVEKGVDTLAEASAYVPEDVQIVFLGGTNDQIKEFKGKYGHNKNISIIGRVDYTEVPQYIASADVLVLPDSAFHTYSNLYTSPMKLFEYMASGRPIVASRIPSLSEVLNEDSAVFFESGNPQSLALKIQQVLGDEVRSKKMSACAREMVTEFTWEKRTKAIVAHILGKIQ